MSLIKRLRHNYHELSKSQRFMYKYLYRHFFGKNSFFYEGVLENPGQMYWRERKAIYETIISFKPNRCFEVGTYNGGGSTYFVSSALHHNNFGKLYTSESIKNYTVELWISIHQSCLIRKGLLSFLTAVILIVSCPLLMRVLTYSYWMVRNLREKQLISMSFL